MSIDRILSNPSHKNKEDARSSHRGIPVSILVVTQNPDESVRREREQENPAVVRNNAPTTFQPYLRPQQVNRANNKSRRQSNDKETSVSNSLPELVEVEDDFDNVGRVPEEPQGK